MSQLKIKQEDGTWREVLMLKGDTGEKGDPGLASETINDNLTDENHAWSSYQTNEKIEKASILNLCINVKDYGAKGDGVTDDTANIQLAIDSNPKQVIFFPKGNYKVTQTIKVNNGVTLMGAVSAINSKRDYHTFNVYTGLDDLASPAFLIGDNCCIKGFTFYYPEQAAVTESIPKDYSYCIANDATYWTNEVCLENLCFVNATTLIYM